MLWIVTVAFLLIKPGWTLVIESSVEPTGPVQLHWHQLDPSGTPSNIRGNRIRRAATTSSFTPDEIKWTNVNEEVDEALEKVWPLLVNNGYTTLTLPNITEAISIKPLIFTYSAALRLSNGHIYNMQGLERIGDTFMTYEFRDKTFQILLSLNIKNMQFVYDFILGIIGISGGGTVEGFLDNTLVTGDLSITGDSASLRLNNFKVVSFGLLQSCAECTLAEHFIPLTTTTHGNCCGHNQDGLQSHCPCCYKPLTTDYLRNLGVRLKTGAILSQISGSILTPITRLFENHIITSISDMVGDQLSDLMDDINEVDQLELKKLLNETLSRLTG